MDLGCTRCAPRNNKPCLARTVSGATRTACKRGLYSPKAEPQALCSNSSLLGSSQNQQCSARLCRAHGLEAACEVPSGAVLGLPPPSCSASTCPFGSLSNCQLLRPKMSGEEAAGPCWFPPTAGAAGPVPGGFRGELPAAPAKLSTATLS